MSLTQAPRLLEGMGAAEREKERTQRKEGVGHPPRLSRERAVACWQSEALWTRSDLASVCAGVVRWVSCSQRSPAHLTPTLKAAS